MIKEIQYCIDGNGNKVSVIIPFKDWEIITKQNTKLQAKLNFITGINEALEEVKQARKAGQVLPALAEFINESRS